MPGFYYDSISRKRFLQQLTAAAATPFLSSYCFSQAADEPVRFALLSDTHTPVNEQESYRGFFPTKNLAQIVPAVIASKPQGVIINGDAARLVGLKADYVRLKELLSPIAQLTPIFIGLGNHDHRENFHSIFAKQLNDDERQEGISKHVSVIETKPVRIIVLDSLLYVDKVAGLLGKEQRNWLVKFLGQADHRPTVFFIHHTLGDGDGDLLDTDRLFQLLKPFKHVKAIFYGHSHRYEVTERQNIRLINLPAVGYNFSDDQPVGWIDSEFTTGGVKMTLHAIGGNTQDQGKSTNVEWL